MRYLAAVNETVQGPAKFNGKLPSLGKDAQDVRVLAYPVKGLSAKTIVADNVENQNEVLLSGNETMTARSLVLHLVDEGEGDMELAVRKGDEWVTVDKYYLDRSNTNPNVGFIPLAPYVFSLPEIGGPTGSRTPTLSVQTRSATAITIGPKIFWSELRDLNPRHSAPKADALARLS